MSEISILFTFKRHKVQTAFPNNSELFIVYAYCAKTFKCGIFILKYDNINLNFLNKNTRLSSIFNSSQPKYDISIYLSQKSKQPLQQPAITSLDLIFNKGSLSSLIQNTTFNKTIGNAVIRSFNLHSQLLNAFYLIYSGKHINRLELSYTQFRLLDESNLHYQMPFISSIIELCIYDKDSIRPNQIKLKDINIQYLKLMNLEVIQLNNVFVEFHTELIHLEKIIKNNSYGLTKGINYSKIHSIKLLYKKHDDMMAFLRFLSKKITQLNSLTIKYDSIDLTGSLSIIKFLSHRVFSLTNSIYLNLIARLSIQNDDSNDQAVTLNEYTQLNTEDINNILSKIKELKLRPYNTFTETDLDFFKGKLPSLTLFKISNHDIINQDYFESFFKSINTNNKLSYVNIGQNILLSFGDKVYKIFSYDNTLFKSDIFSLISPKKINKITLPCIEYNKKTKAITLLGDIIPDKINEAFYLFVKHLLFSIDTISVLTIQSFDESTSDFLNKILINMLNVILSPKLNSIVLSSITITKALIDKLSFILMDSASTLSKIVIDDIKTKDEETEYLFYSMLFQPDYLCLRKVAIKNISIGETISSLLKDNNILEIAGLVSLESIEDFANIESILLDTKLNGIELMNVNIDQEILQRLLRKNANEIEFLSLDLSFDVIQILQQFSFPKLRKLKIHNGCYYEISNKTKNLFIKRRSWHMTKLCKLKINEEKMEEKGKMIAVYKYLNNIS